MGQDNTHTAEGESGGVIRVVQYAYRIKRIWNDMYYYATTSDVFSRSYPPYFAGFGVDTRDGSVLAAADE